MIAGEMSITNSRVTTEATNKLSLRTAALVAGIGLLIMVLTAPFAELYVFPKLIVRDNAAETFQNILANRTLFVGSIFAYLVTFVCDVLVAWALYALLKPVHEQLSQLTAWFRMVYTVLAIAALTNLVSVVRLLNGMDALTATQLEQLPDRFLLSVNAFKSDWYFGLLFFAIHLGLLGYLVFRSRYVPKLLGVLLIITGVGYFVTALRPFFPSMNVDLASYTFYGELLFMLWLLIWGPRIQVSQ